MDHHFAKDAFAAVELLLKQRLDLKLAGFRDFRGLAVDIALEELLEQFLSRRRG